MNKARPSKEERAAMADRFFSWLHRVLTAAPPPETEAYDEILREAKITQPLGWGSFLRFLAATMIEYSGHGEDMMASIRTIAADSHIGKSSAQRYLDAAVRLRMLEQTRPPGKRSSAAYAIADWDWDGDQPRAAHAEDQPEQVPPEPLRQWEGPQETIAAVDQNGHEDRFDRRWPLLPDQRLPLPDEYPYPRPAWADHHRLGRRTGTRRRRTGATPSPG